MAHAAHSAPNYGDTPFLQKPVDRATSTSDLITLARAISTLSDVAAGLSCQPRMEEASGAMSVAGREFEDISEFIGNYLMDVMARLADARAKTRLEAEDRSVALIVYDLGCDADVTEVVVKAASKAFPERF